MDNAKSPFEIARTKRMARITTKAPLLLLETLFQIGQENGYAQATKNIKNKLENVLHKEKLFEL